MRAVQERAERALIAEGCTRVVELSNDEQGRWVVVSGSAAWPAFEAGGLYVAMDIAAEMVAERFEGVQWVWDADRATPVGWARVDGPVNAG